MKHRKNSKKQNQKSISELWENFMHVLMYKELKSLKEKRNREGNNIFKEIIKEKIQIWCKLQIHRFKELNNL